MSEYYLVLRDSSPNSNPIYLRFQIGHSGTSMIYLLEKVHADVLDVASQWVDTQYSGCVKALIRGDESHQPVSWPTDDAREIWKERIGEGRWGRISEEEVYQECVPEYIMHQIIDGMPVE